MKCWTLFQLVVIRAYMNCALKKLEGQDAKEFNRGEAVSFLIDRIGRIWFATSNMMEKDDLHINQLCSGL